MQVNRNSIGGGLRSPPLHSAQHQVSISGAATIAFCEDAPRAQATCMMAQHSSSTLLLLTSAACLCAPPVSSWAPPSPSPSSPSPSASAQQQLAAANSLQRLRDELAEASGTTASAVKFRGGRPQRRNDQLVSGLFRSLSRRPAAAGAAVADDHDGGRSDEELLDGDPVQLKLGNRQASLMTIPNYLTTHHVDDGLASIRGPDWDGTGGSLWMSAVALQRFLSSTGLHFVRGRRCVELGTGTGAVSIAAARLGAVQAVATDGNPVMVALADLNAHLNLDQPELSRFAAARYLWGGEAPSFPSDFTQSFSTVLLTDLLYSEAKVGVLLDAVMSVCASDCDVLVAYEKRDMILTRHKNGTSR
jgi:predicted nicotinamide N-methyase